MMLLTFFPFFFRNNHNIDEQYCEVIVQLIHAHFQISVHAHGFKHNHRNYFIDAL